VWDVTVSRQPLRHSGIQGLARVPPRSVGARPTQAKMLPDRRTLHGLVPHQLASAQTSISAAATVVADGLSGTEREPIEFHELNDTLAGCTRGPVRCR
jgi:hypothetical protein